MAMTRRPAAKRRAGPVQLGNVDVEHEYLFRTTDRRKLREERMSLIVGNNTRKFPGCHSHGINHNMEKRREREREGEEPR